MPREITLNGLETVLEECSYPVTRATVADELGDVRIQLADGETTLRETLDWIETDSFASVDELEGEIYNALPREAVGEPYQSEGEG